MKQDEAATGETIANGKPKARRGPGRPQSAESRNISRTTILRTALKLASSVPLQDLSIVNVAKALNVTPALIHYYIGGRDWLTSGVMNLFYKDLLRSWPVATGEWQADLLAGARTVFDQFARYGGIAAYAVSNSRFRVFQLTAFGDKDYGVEVLDRFIGCVRASGLSGERTGIYANQILDFIMSTGNSTSHHIYPSQHRSFLEEKKSKLDLERYANIAFAGSGPLTIDGDVAFSEGCRLFLLGITTEIAGSTLADALETRS